VRGDFVAVSEVLDGAARRLDGLASAAGPSSDLALVAFLAGARRFVGAFFAFGASGVAASFESAGSATFFLGAARRRELDFGASDLVAAALVSVSVLSATFAVFAGALRFRAGLAASSDPSAFFAGAFLGAAFFTGALLLRFGFSAVSVLAWLSAFGLRDGAARRLPFDVAFDLAAGLLSGSDAELLSESDF